MNHAVFKALLFLGAGAFERAVGSLEIDRLGGLLRRMPWTGGAFLVGAMAIAGLPPLNGFASEWLTLQALLHVPRYGHIGDGIAGALALAALAATAALAVFCFVKVVGLVLLGRRERRPSPPPRSRRCRCGPRSSSSRSPASCSASLPACCSARSSASRRGRRRRPTPLGLHLPGTGSLPTRRDRARARRLSRLALALLRGSRRAAPAPTWASGQLVEPALDWTSAGFTKSLRLVLEFVLRPEREISSTTRARRRCRRSRTAAACRI